MRALALLLLLLPAAAEAAPSWLDPKLSREDRVKACARCHQGAYDGWKRGPHSHAQSKLDWFVAEVERDKNWPASVRWRNKNKVMCMHCHASTNVYEGGLPLDWDGREDLAKRRLKNRPDGPEAATGIDCLTCHVAGDRVVTGKEYKPHGKAPADPDFCRPLASKTFSTAMNCTNCHVEIPRHPDYAKRMEAGNRYFETSDCLTCHMEKKDGRYTHYMYWRDHEGPEPPALRIFDRIGVKYTDAGGRASAKISWKNDFAPHDLFRELTPTQFLVNVVVRDAKGAAVETRTVRVQSPLYTPPAKQEVPLWHKDPMHTLDVGQRFEQALPLTTPPGQIASLGLEVWRKRHVWLPDSYGKRVYTRDITPKR